MFLVGKMSWSDFKSVSIFIFVITFLNDWKKKKNFKSSDGDRGKFLTELEFPMQKHPYAIVSPDSVKADGKLYIPVLTYLKCLVQCLVVGQILQYVPLVFDIRFLF